jgi:hypothetical protein
MGDDREPMELSRRGWPKCDQCGRLMQLVGIESDDANPRASLHTYECVCGEITAVTVTQM